MSRLAVSRLVDLRLRVTNYHEWAPSAHGAEQQAYARTVPPSAVETKKRV